MVARGPANGERDDWKTFSELFEPEVRAVGQHQFEAGRVAPRFAQLGAFAADVHDEIVVEQARMLQLDSAMYYSCSCPRFQASLAGCEHLWAATRTQEATEAMSPALTHRLTLVPKLELSWPGLLDYVDDEYDRDEGEDEDEGEGEVYSDADRDELLLSAPEPKGTRPAGVHWQTLQQSVLQRSRPSTEVEVRYFLAEEQSSGWSIAVAKQKRGAAPARLAPARLTALSSALDGLDLELTSMIQNLREHDYYRRASGKAQVKTAAIELLLPRLVSTGRCHLLPRRPTGLLAQRWHLFGEGTPPNQLSSKLGTEGYAELLTLPLLAADDTGPWELELQLSQATEQGKRSAPLDYEARGELVRGDERRSLEQVRLATRNGALVFADGVVGSCNASDARWLSSLRELFPADSLLVPRTQLNAFLDLGFGPKGVSRLSLPTSFERVTGIAAQPVLQLGAPRGRSVSGQVFFEYGETRISVQHPSALVLLGGERERERALERDRDAERAALEVLRQAGFDGEALGGRSSAGADVKIAGAAVLPAVRAALEAGFQVFAEGKRYRALSTFDIQVESGLDWFEVRGNASFGDTPVALPALLRQVQRGTGLVELGDGSFGMLPTKWLARWGGLAQLAPKKNGPLRFSTRQLGIAEALLGALDGEAELPGLEPLREQVNRFYEVTPLVPPATFLGSLRAYQAHGLSWLGALSELGVGACLADDMGLGKTIQVLAHFARLYAPAPAAAPAPKARGKSRSKQRAPSLIVMPRSLLSNWASEAARFAPELRVHTHWGPERGEVTEAFRDVDVVFTTYSTMRLDIEALSQLELGTVVLDEAQAIKNASSATAKSARLLRAEHRIALSGTPIENHLGELWSLFEFLNPGMLAELPGLARALNSGEPSADALLLIQRVLRPFVLRRTKQEVASDLPERSEQTLFVELEPEERKHYDQLLQFYRASIAKQGLTDAARGTPHVLEALLRLRQAACHPGLIDPARAGERSSKVELLLERLRGLASEGHQALVFSQFTSLLAILRKRLEEEGISYEYLDGKTRDRAAAVARFQGDPTLSVFLISLKAGGVGLNLTAADYVFILDPWWNPAVEAQAVDRAHRIGQTRPVIAYRVLARNTVEERVAQLQDKKRQLVAAVMGDEGAFAGKLTRGDLESLLGLSEA